MDEDQKRIYNFLLKLGLSALEAQIYTVLAFHGNQTTLEISKLVNAPRTTVYRLIEDLKQKGIIEEQIDHHRTFAKAVSIDKIETILKKKEDEIKKLQTLFPGIAQILSQKSNHEKSLTKVLYYRGKDGMKQMLWNTLKTKDLFRGYSYCTPVETCGQDFAVEWALEFKARNLSGRDFYSDMYLKSSKNHPYPKSITWQNWESRYIAADILNIDHQIDIYNDVCAFYCWHGGEIFGVEIYNQKVANLQKQIFDLLWKMDIKDTI